MSSTDEARAALAKLTPGKWELMRYKHGGGRIFVEGIGRHYEGRALIADMEPDKHDESDAGAAVYHEGDREFLFAAPTIVLDLADKLDAAEAEIARLRDEAKVAEQAVLALLHPGPGRMTVTTNICDCGVPPQHSVGVHP